MVKIDLFLDFDIFIVQVGDKAIHDEQNDQLKRDKNLCEKHMKLRYWNSINLKAVLLLIACCDHVVERIYTNDKDDQHKHEAHNFKVCEKVACRLVNFVDLLDSAPEMKLLFLQLLTTWTASLT